MRKSRVLLIDYVKGIAILGIVLFHLIHDYMDSPAIISKLSIFAGSGIHLFNLCSGFGLALSYLYKPVGWKEFFVKRFAKIYIPYAMAITLYFVFSVVTFNGESAIASYLSHIFLYKMFFSEHMISFGGHFWYISTIIQFYASFLLLMAVKRRIGSKNLFLCSCAVSLFWMAFTSLLGKADVRIWNNFFLQYLWEYGLGIYLADLYAQNKIDLRKKIPLVPVLIITVISGAIFAVTGLKGGVLKNFNDIFAFASISGVYFLIYKTKIFTSIMVSISKFSYEFYLLHILVFDISFALLRGRLPDLIIGIAALIISIVVSKYYSVLTQFLCSKIPAVSKKT